MKKEFTLGIDIDGTVTDPYTFIPHLNQYFNKNFLYNEITTYDLTKLYNIDEEEYLNWYSHYGADIYQTAPLAKDAKKTLSYLKQSYRLIYISAREEEYRLPTMKWFESQGLPFDRVVLTGSPNKIQQAIEYEIDLFLEDHYVASCQMAQELNIPILLFDTPYNQGPLPEQVTRVYSWQEAKQKITQYTQKVMKR
ncbi:hypothetical protein U473_03695 [Tepidibacillus decaturensis]|uniref:Nucleotidase n=1 Tax=Tepidibacillus decaturensis TaxID=1413211 RepID=A0A135L821_9BACI|nr:hypothetical protein U473_03695 [Tepidibacillus decaturensis]